MLDLNRIIYNNMSAPNFTNKNKKAKWYRKLTKDSLYIIDSHFVDRAKSFIKIFHSKFGLEYS